MEEPDRRANRGEAQAAPIAPPATNRTATGEVATNHAPAPVPIASAPEAAGIDPRGTADPRDRAPTDVIETAEPTPEHDRIVEHLSGGAKMDPLTGTMCGPTGPTGMATTDGGAVSLEEPPVPEPEEQSEERSKEQ